MKIAKTLYDPLFFTNQHLFIIQEYPTHNSITSMAVTYNFGGNYQSIGSFTAETIQRRQLFKEETIHGTQEQN